MKSQRLVASAFGTCLLFALAPSIASAQAASATPAGGGGGGAGGGGAGGGGLGSSNLATTNIRNTITIPAQASTSGNGSATTIPSNSNPLTPWYGNPISMGNPAVYTNTFGPLAKPVVTFGKGVYVTTTTTAGGASTTTNQATGFTTYGNPRTPSYSTGLSSDIPMVDYKTTALQSDLRTLIDRSNYLKSQRTIQIRVSGDIVQLVGQVASQKEFQLVEGMVRMTPGVVGVRDVQNDLQILDTKSVVSK